MKQNNDKAPQHKFHVSIYKMGDGGCLMVKEFKPEWNSMRTGGLRALVKRELKRQVKIAGKDVVFQAYLRNITLGITKRLTASGGKIDQEWEVS